MYVEGKHSRTLFLEDSDESLALQDVADLAEAELEEHREEWTGQRVERVEDLIEEIRGIR